VTACPPGVRRERRRGPLHLIQLLDQRHRRRRGTLGREGLDKPAACMGHAPDLDDVPRLIEPIVPGVGVGFEGAAKVGEPRRRPIALVRCGGVEDHLLPQGIEVDPEAPLKTPALVAEHGDARVVGLEVVRGDDLSAQLLPDRRHRRRDVRHPITQRRAGEVDAFTGEDAGEPMQRRVIDILGHDHERQQPFAGEAIFQPLEEGPGPRRRPRGSAGRHTWRALFR